MVWEDSRINGVYFMMNVFIFSKRMDIMRSFIAAWNKWFDERKYPRRFYSDTLKKNSLSNNSEELGKHVIYFLHWNDGKVVKDGNVPYQLEGVRYKFNPVKPNTYNEQKHQATLTSDEFYTWAKKLMGNKTFDASQILFKREAFSIMEYFCCNTFLCSSYTQPDSLLIV